MTAIPGSGKRSWRRYFSFGENQGWIPEGRGTKQGSPFARAPRLL